MTNYATVEAVRALISLDQPSHDGVLAHHIEAASRLIDALFRHRDGFWAVDGAAPYPLYLDYEHGWFRRLPPWRPNPIRLPYSIMRLDEVAILTGDDYRALPATAYTAISENRGGDGPPYTALQGDSPHVWPHRNGSLRGHRVLRITGIWGRSWEAPPLVAHATAVQAVHMYLASQRAYSGHGRDPGLVDTSALQPSVMGMLKTLPRSSGSWGGP